MPAAAENTWLSLVVVGVDPDVAGTQDTAAPSCPLRVRIANSAAFQACLISKVKLARVTAPEAKKLWNSCWAGEFWQATLTALQIYPLQSGDCLLEIESGPELLKQVHPRMEVIEAQMMASHLYSSPAKFAFMKEALERCFGVQAGMNIA